MRKGFLNLLEPESLGGLDDRCQQALPPAKEKRGQTRILDKVPLYSQKML